MIVLNRPDAELLEFLNLFDMCKEFRQLPFAGGLLDQPFKLYTVFEIIQSAKYEKQAKEAKTSARNR